ncbi:MAG: UDP-3-O-(3-hydroxymyristoyl)glucosamine N-acyltransferase [Bacteroidia bacterium]|nr:UDP-3-O-(3-hydroxymyristoyl)glucosamine N-acyltransferase [Bacteroidota bacterium]MBK8414494.1 UDP-3-O-(3-hydroxymyristoyl)glucosamine N-acyltransferase [Bacteroidota bacterium]MBK9424689.1 UDP-3-O-(3-hydroxymyristoyl)glucosamine N-acyltransferase [Bacteroidota bacterium]MBP9081769.1 UDP-3-O-(3-hydroxymyristoyl)glucosamine N-acyltransferase [Bacteroidia bacterium]
MEFTAKQISDLLQGTIDGDPGTTVNKLAKIEEGTPGSLSFLGNPKYIEYVYTSKASIIIVGNDFVPENPVSATLIRVEDARGSFAKLLEMYNQVMRDKKGIETPSFIASSATVGNDPYIGAFAYIGNKVKLGNNVKIYPNCYIGDNVTIGDNTTLFAGAKIYSDCVIGASVTIHAGVIIGGDGFGFAPSSGSYAKVAQIGNVIIEDHVEIGSGTTIDRATLGSTIIRKGVKLDNLIQIAHNVEVGANTVIAAQTGIAGSTKIGKDCMIGGQVGIVGHITIADNTKIAAQSGVGSAVTEPGQIIQGSPAFGISDYRRSYVVFRKLPDLEKKISELEKALAEIRQTIS